MTPRTEGAESLVEFVGTGIFRKTERQGLVVAPQWTSSPNEITFTQMRSLLTSLFLLPFLAQAIAAGSELALEAELPFPLEEGEFPASMIDEVLIPNPSELFSIMDKLGEPDWNSCLRPSNKVMRGGDRTDLALRFGTTIADGFIAVQAEDPPTVLDLGRDILDLSRDLGLEDAVFPHCQAIIEACDKKDWDRVRDELDLTHKTVRDSMERIRDGDLAQCVSMGGWLRGTEALTKVISNSYNIDKAEILNQPDLAAYFIRQLDQMDTTPALAQVRTGLVEIEALMVDHAADHISADTVLRIHKISSSIVTSISPPTNELNP